MIHEIHPKKYNVEYKNCKPRPQDTVFLFDGDTVCCRSDAGAIAFPRLVELGDADSEGYLYLFSIDDERFFIPGMNSLNTLNAAPLPAMDTNTLPAPDASARRAWDAGAPQTLEATVLFEAAAAAGYGRQECGIFRVAAPRYLAFAAVTAQQLYLWYRNNRHCGRCGGGNAYAQAERACVCTECGLVTYPRISPVVIVAVTNEERLLVTRYKDRPYRRYALVAGFAEIGESLEDTVRREVFEETGVKVKNIRYYKSQPWAFTSTLLSGFYCDLDGDPAITVDGRELAEAKWMHRNDLPPADSDIALTAEMMERFRLGETESR